MITKDLEMGTPDVFVKKLNEQPIPSTQQIRSKLETANFLIERGYVTDTDAWSLAEKLIIKDLINKKRPGDYSS